MPDIRPKQDSHWKEYPDNERWQFMPAHLKPHYSSCHATLFSDANIYWVQADGSEAKIGNALFCAWDGWEGKKRIYCDKIHRVSMFRDWPKSLSRDHFLKIWNKRPPGYWLSYGYHVIQGAMDWANMRDFDYLPLKEDWPELIPEARKIVAYRQKFGSVFDSNGLLRKI